MKSLREFLKEEKKSCVGNCRDSFDEYGDSINPSIPYRDVSHFAYGEENAHKISAKEFEKNATIPNELKTIHKLKSTLHLHDKDNNVLMMHDTNSDVHYFFG